MLRRILGHRLLHNTPPCRRRPHWWWVWYKYYWRNHQHYNYHVILHYQQPKRRWNLFHPFPVKVHTYYIAIHIMEPFDINVIIWFFFFWSGKIKPFLIWTLKQNHLFIPQLNHLFILHKKNPTTTAISETKCANTILYFVCFLYLSKTAYSFLILNNCCRLTILMTNV